MTLAQEAISAMKEACDVIDKLRLQNAVLIEALEEISNHLYQRDIDLGRCREMATEALRRVA